MFNGSSLQRLLLLHPAVAAKFRLMDDKLSVDPVVITNHDQLELTQGLRTWEMQDALYSQKRLPLLQVNAKRLAVGWASITDAENTHTVTNARPGYSWHQFGMCGDVAPLAYDKIPDWNEERPIWKIIIAAGILVGFVSGATWRTFPDTPHFQLPGIPETPDDNVRKIYALGGLHAVYTAYDQGKLAA